MSPIIDINLEPMDPEDLSSSSSNTFGMRRGLFLIALLVLEIAPFPKVVTSLALCFLPFPALDAVSAFCLSFSFGAGVRISLRASAVVVTSLGKDLEAANSEERVSESVWYKARDSRRCGYRLDAAMVLSGPV